jgi:RNA recognition motif-containing protein
MFQWDANQTQPTASGEPKIWAAQSVSRRGTVYSTCHNQVVEPPVSAPEAVPDAERTTIMLRNLPNSFSRDALAEVLDREGFKARYDFVYMPMNFKKGVVFGYAFVNLLTPVDALEAKEHFQGFSWPGTSGAVDVLWCGTQQGLEALVERFRSSPVMHEVVPDAVRPAVYSGGVRSIFPPPTKPIKMPNMRADCD